MSLPADEDKPIPVIAICINNRFATDKPSCGAMGGIELAKALETGVLDRNLNTRVERLVCFGACYKGPNVRIVPGGKFHHHATVADAASILDEAEERCGARDSFLSGGVPLAPGT